MKTFAKFKYFKVTITLKGNIIDSPSRFEVKIKNRRLDVPQYDTFPFDSATDAIDFFDDEVKKLINETSFGLKHQIVTGD